MKELNKEQIERIRVLVNIYGSRKIIKLLGLRMNKDTFLKRLREYRIFNPNEADKNEYKQRVLNADYPKEQLSHAQDFKLIGFKSLQKAHNSGRVLNLHGFCICIGAIRDIRNNIIKWQTYFENFNKRYHIENKYLEDFVKDMNKAFEGIRSLCYDTNSIRIFENICNSLNIVPVVYKKTKDTPYNTNAENIFSNFSKRLYTDFIQDLLQKTIDIFECVNIINALMIAEHFNDSLPLEQIIREIENREKRITLKVPQIIK